MNKMIPSNYSELLRSYLVNKKFKIGYEGALCRFCAINAGVLQGVVLGPTLYLLYAADIPNPSKANMTNFTDDTAIMASGDTPSEATEK